MNVEMVFHDFNGAGGTGRGVAAIRPTLLKYAGRE